MGFFAMIVSMLLGILFVTTGISRRKQKRWSIILKKSVIITETSVLSRKSRYS